MCALPTVLNFCRENLENQGKDAAFMQMLHNLDRCHMNHEEKWALFIKHTADKAEFRYFF